MIKMMRSVLLLVYLPAIFLLITAEARSEDKKAVVDGTAKTTESAPAAEVAPKADELVIKMGLPLFSPLFSEVPVAKVNADCITLKELGDAVMTSHEQRMEQTAGKINYNEILNRLVTSRLILQEARDMGIDELPQTKEAVANYKKRLLREMTIKRSVNDVKPDQGEVDRIYKDLTREWQIKSVLFDQEDDAKKMLEEIKAGKSFEELAGKAVEDKKAKGNEPEEFVRPDTLLPYVAEVVAGMEAGKVSPVVKIHAGKANSGYSVIKLVDIRYVDNDEAKEKAGQEALTKAKGMMFDNYKKALIGRYVKVDKKLLNSIDFTAKKPGIERLLKDKRILGVVRGDKPITVGILANELKSSFYHGVKIAIEEKRINEKKYEVLSGMIEKALLEKEAFKQGIDRTDEYRKKVDEYLDSILFGMFIEKVVAPDIHLGKEDIEAYYKEHLSEFSSPEMMRISSLAFKKKEDAENAAGKLGKGTDYNWLVSNAEGQVEKDAKGLLVFEGNLITVKSVPEGIQKVLAGAKAAEVKIGKGPEGYYYVLLIKQVVPSQNEDLEKVQEGIAKQIYEKKLKDSVEEWGARLRKAGDVKVYLSQSN